MCSNHSFTNLTCLLLLARAVSRHLHLSLSLLLLGGCKVQVVPHGRETSPQKVLTWAIGPDQQQLLVNALYRAGRIYEPDLTQLKRFYYYPVVLNRRGEGLYYVTQFTHHGLVGVLHSKRGLSIVEMGLTDSATQDSVVAALRQHGNRFTQRFRQAVLDEYQE